MTDTTKPLTADEIEEVRLAATKLPPRSYNTVQRLIATIEQQAEQIKKLRKALSGLVADIREYERINHLCPNPGHDDCWQSITNAREALAATEPQP